MSTRGVFGFKIKDKYKLSYISSDAQFKNIAEVFIDDATTILKRKSTSIYDVEEVIREIENIESSEIADDDPIRYSLLGAFDGGAMIMNNEFIENKLLCEYGYIFNISDCTIEFYRNGNRVSRIHFEDLLDDDLHFDASEYVEALEILSFYESSIVFRHHERDRILKRIQEGI